jgi:hypothetical protein
MNRTAVIATAMLATLAATARPAQAIDRLCDPANEDCRIILINLIRNERVGIDVAFWFMEDSRYSTELINRFNAGVPVRVLMDTEANASYPLNADRLNELRAAGIPMRQRVASGILHWKMMLFAGQNTVQFSGANYSANAFVYTGDPYSNYIDEAIYFSDLPSVVDSFKTKFDDLWTNTSAYANYANVSGALARRYDSFPKDPELNFPPAESYRSRAVGRYNAETSGIDVIMYRITDRAHTDAIIAARQRGLRVRLIHEQQQYRDASRLWHSWNIDRLYMAGVEIKNRGHAGLNHQKSVPNAGAAKVSSPAASPSNYFELTFTAEAGRPYRLWMRGKADGNNWANDSVFVQFSGSVNASGSSIWRIGTTSATDWNLEDCSGCGLSGWGWQDNGWGVGVMGPVVYFATTGTQRIRIQQREDGVSIDQIVLSPSTYLNASPGALTNDTRILTRTQ